MSEITDKKQQATASRLRNMLSIYNANYDLVTIGAYKSGTNPQLDEALLKVPKMNEFLTQKVDEHFSYEETVRMMEQAIS